MSQEELTSVYLDSDLFLLPTKYEIFGMVLLEAVSFGVPVITSYNGGASTIIQDEANGIIIKEFDVNKWCDSIIRCINRSNRNTTKREVQTNKMDKFSWENIAKQIMDTMAIL